MIEKDEIPTIVFFSLAMYFLLFGLALYPAYFYFKYVFLEGSIYDTVAAADWTLAMHRELGNLFLSMYWWVFLVPPGPIVLMWYSILRDS